GGNHPRARGSDAPAPNACRTTTATTGPTPTTPASTRPTPSAPTTTTSKPGTTGRSSKAPGPDPWSRPTTPATPNTDPHQGSKRNDAAGSRAPRDQQPNARAITTCWISLVPSPISSTLASQ